MIVTKGEVIRLGTLSNLRKKPLVNPIAKVNKDHKVNCKASELIVSFNGLKSIFSMGAHSYV
jgi:hypothetical protein